MKTLRDRMSQHAEKVRQNEEMEAVLAGVFNKENEEARVRFVNLIQQVIRPAFDEFRAALRELERDGVIVTNIANGGEQQSISIALVDRYLRFGVGKTIKLVNPKQDIAKTPNSKFYEVFRSGDSVSIRMRWEANTPPTVTDVGYEDVTRKFMENELAAFFERAYPTAKPKV